MKNILKNCTLCPRGCHINRYLSKGFCNEGFKIRVSLADLYFYEEPCISGINGSGAIFFSGCNLKCCFCQNYKISIKNYGINITIKRLSEIMLDLEHKKAHNINLVTPTIYVPQIIKAIKKAKKNGLTIPIIYNSSGYDTLETIKMLDGYIDIYLPDFKYMDNNIAEKYSQAKNYSEYAKESIHEMIRQVGPCQFNKDGLLQKGVIVRHLILPNHKNDSKNILNYLYKNYQNNIYYSIMNQYTPNKYVPFKELKKKVKKEDYDDIILYAINLGIINAYCQLDGTVNENFVPDFNKKGLK